MTTPEIRSYKDLIVWQKSMDLVDLIYRLTATFPRTEQFGLMSQMQRSAVSIPSNIAEGRCRGTRKDFRQFLAVALGSAAELQTQTEIAKRQSFGKSDLYPSIEMLLVEIMKMLNVLISKMKADPPYNLTPKT
jgi:four helix bundle protein